VNPGKTRWLDAAVSLPFRPIWRSDRAGILGLLLVTLIASNLLFNGGVLIGQDSATQFYPWYDYLGERLLAFDLPGWNPFQFAGVPFAADPQSGWMYLPAMLFFTLFSLALAVPMFISFHLLLAGLGAYVLSRLLGVGVGGALVAGAAYELASPLYGRSVCCPAQFEVGAWMPIALIGAEIAIRNRHWAWRVIGWTIGGLAVSQAMSAWLGQGGYYFLLILAAFIAYRTLIDPADRAQRWISRIMDGALHGAAIFASGFGLAAAGILPRLAYVERSNVAGGEYGGESAWASQIGGLTAGMTWDHMLDPGLYYPGVAVLILSFAAIVLARRRYAAPFFLGLGLSAVVLAMPWESPLHTVMYALLPKFEELHQHWPERVAIVSYLSIAMLAGASVESLIRGRLRARRILAAFGIPVTALIILAIANADIPIVVIVAMLATLLLVLALLLPQSRAIRPVLPLLMVIIIATDLLVSFNAVSAEAPYGGFHRVDLREYYAPSAAAEFLKERMKDEPGRYIGFDPEQRVVSDGQEVLYRYQFAAPDTGAILVNNRGVLHGVEDVQGYNPVQPRRFVEYLTALNGTPQEYHDANIYQTGLNSPLLDLLNIRYIVIPASVPPDRLDLRDLEAAFPTIYQDSQVQVLENVNALPRAWVVHEAQQVASAQVLPMLASGAVDPWTTALLETTPPEIAPSAEGGVNEAAIVTEQPELLRVSVTTDAPGLLILSETYDPGWNAYIDGEPVELLTANYLLRAVPVPAGSSTVELRYEPREMKFGLAISGLTALLLFPAFIFAVRRRKPYGS
jgi:hypothetical protein